MKLERESVLNTLLHIQKPYPISEIFRMYESGNFNAELLLQHSLINMAMLEMISKQLLNQEK